VNDESPRETIRELPRERARLGLPRASWRGSMSPAPPRSRRGRPGRGRRRGVLIAVFAFGGLRWQAERRATVRAEAAREELAEMQLEHARLAAELQALQREPGPRPRWSLSGDDRAELVIDFDRLAGRTRPASSVQRTSGPVVR